MAVGKGAAKVFAATLLAGLAGFAGTACRSEANVREEIHAGFMDGCTKEQSKVPVAARTHCECVWTAFSEPRTTTELKELAKLGERSPQLIAAVDAATDACPTTLRAALAEICVKEGWFAERAPNRAKFCKCYVEEVTFGRSAREIAALAKESAYANGERSRAALVGCLR